MLHIVKEGKRHRYIAFYLKSNNRSINKNNFINEMESQCQNLFSKKCKDLGIYLIRFNQKYGIVKCNHLEKDKTIKLIKSIQKINLTDVKIETLGTSGTIKTLVSKFINIIVK